MVQNPDSSFQGASLEERRKKEYKKKIIKEEYKIQNQSTERKKKIGDSRIQNEEITYVFTNTPSLGREL